MQGEGARWIALERRGEERMGGGVGLSRKGCAQPRRECCSQPTLSRPESKHSHSPAESSRW
eukprot:1815626-Rhodomonas_salina.2